MPSEMPNDSARLAELYRYDVLGGGNEEAFDRITRIAKIALHMPIALMTFIDKDRQLFKSKQGTDISETPLDVSFCVHAIRKNEPTVIDDLQKDSRFSFHPFVLDGPMVRFYAGVPIRTPGGHNLGTVCVLDRQPRKLSLDEMVILNDLSHLAIDALEFRRLQMNNKLMP